ncbi:protein kinase domain-containing protein [Methanoplanus endosymbiosus]|uniref:Protein kinase n=1 Tax=Methanoplanus endosymbiosus TaxID=33865 RepID=A0A9E7TKQ3_9EURY|nr:protein kinase [Methanoplanus endosymbiosus]UUX91456.1 protein kinase [Methanoplanus endosymbiosus]
MTIPDIQSKSKINGFLYFLLLLSLLILLIPNAALGAPVYVGGNDGFSDIASAVNSTKPGDTVIVNSGVYAENLLITKSINIIGNDSGQGTPKIESSYGDAAVKINADYVTVDGLIISGNADSGVVVRGNNITVSNCDIQSTPSGITISQSLYVTVRENTIRGHELGLFIDESDGCSVYLNDFENNDNVRCLSSGVVWHSSDTVYNYRGNNFTSSLGNYWNDYVGTDGSGDGIGDVPYTGYSGGKVFVPDRNFYAVNGVNPSGGRIFSGENLVEDDYPLISHVSDYMLPHPGGFSGVDGFHGKTVGDNRSRIPEYNIGDLSEMNLSRPPQNPPATPLLSGVSPPEVVVLMLLMSGVIAGMFDLVGGYREVDYRDTRIRRNGIKFLYGGYIAIAIAMLYSVISYTSRLIIRNIDYGIIQISFIALTTFLIASSAILSYNFIKGGVPVLLSRLHAPLAAFGFIFYFISIYTAPVDLGPFNSIIYPVCLILSVFMPLLYFYIYESSAQKSVKEEIISGFYPEVLSSDTIVASVDYNNTTIFDNESGIMGSALSGSYFPECLGERYSDVEFIGKGGIARVFKVSRRDDGAVVAVKVPINFDEVTGRFFMKEMRIWEELSHKNIVKLFSVNILPVPFVEMEYVVSDLSESEKPLSVMETLKIIEGIAEGLSYAHNLGIIHRDIKPQNILVTEEGIAKITDWGLGKMIADGHETTVVGFSLNYAAPEQIAPRRFGSPDERTDIYQMGVVLYELVVGMRPFFGGGVGEMTDEIIHRMPMKPSENRSSDEPFDKIIMKCLEKMPEDRYQNVKEFLSDLRQLKENLSSQGKI